MGTPVAVPFRILAGVFVLVLLLVLEPTASITSTSTMSLSTSTTEPAYRRVCGRSVLRSRDHVFAFVAEDLERSVEDRSQLREDRAAANAKALVMFHLRIRDAHPVDSPIDVRSIR